MVASGSRTYHFVITFEVDETTLPSTIPSGQPTLRAAASRMSTGFGRPIPSPRRAAATSRSDVGHQDRPDEDSWSRGGEQRLNGRLRTAARRTCPRPKRAVEPALGCASVAWCPRVIRTQRARRGSRQPRSDPWTDVPAVADTNVCGACWLPLWCVGRQSASTVRKKLRRASARASGASIAA